MSTAQETVAALAESLKGKEFDQAAADALDEKTLVSLVHVFKAPEGVGNVGKWGICFNFKPGEHDESDLADILQSEYGPGDYPVQIKTKVNNRPAILYQKTLHITAPKFKPRADRDQEPAAAQSSDALTAILAQLADGQNRIVEALAHRPEPPAVPTTMEIAKDLAALKDLFADKAPDMMQQMRDFMELKNLLAEETGPADPLTSAIKHFGPMIAAATEEMQNRELGEVRRPTTGRPAPASAAAPERPAQFSPNPNAEREDMQTINAHDIEAEAEAAEPTQQEVDDAFKVFAGLYVPALKHLVGNNAQPQAVAEWVVRHVDGKAEIVRTIGLVIGDDNMVERIVGFDGDMLAHAPWLDAVADWLAHALWPEQNAAPPVADATQDATNGENGEGGTILDGEHSDDSRTHAEIITDAKRIDPSANGDDNDA